MSDWLDRLTPSGRAEWEDMVRHARNETAQMISGSAMVVSMVTEPLDVKFALELGLAIVLDKPILAVVVKGATVPEKLRRVADEIVELADDPDTEEGVAQMRGAVGRIMERLDRESDG